MSFNVIFHYWSMKESVFLSNNQDAWYITKLLNDGSFHAKSPKIRKNFPGDHLRF